MSGWMSEVEVCLRLNWHEKGEWDGVGKVD